jgi:pimeloyl-ACP methyl ester carboxylesterase
MVFRCLFVSVLVSLGVLAAPLLADPPTSAEPPASTVVVVGGVGGLENLKLSVISALHLAGVAADVQGFEWTHGKGHIFKDLQDTRNHTRKSAELAEEILRLQSAEPDRPIYLIGRSAGAVLVLTAAEELPPGTLQRIILLSPAVSPAFDLTAGLRACKGQVVNFYSDMDWFVLGWGTNHFGTADRLYGPSAGKTGFILPNAHDQDTEEHYNRLVQVRWTPAMILQGHTGGHLGTALPSFLAHEVVPWLKP